MKVIEVYSDWGSIRIYNKTTAFYFNNQFGDAPTTIIICESETPLEQAKALKQLGNRDECAEYSKFDVHTEVYLSKYDAVEMPVYKFKPGHYEIELYEPLTFLIRWHPPLEKHTSYDDPENLTAFPQVNLAQRHN